MCVCVYLYACTHLGMNFAEVDLLMSCVYVFMYVLVCMYVYTYYAHTNTHIWECMVIQNILEIHLYVHKHKRAYLVRTVLLCTDTYTHRDMRH
jgi:hypothetical protein